MKRHMGASLSVLVISCLVTAVYAEQLIIPRDLVEYGRAKGCEQILDFYDRPGVIKPPYVYGYLPGRSEDSVVFWCQTGQGKQRKFWLVVKRNKMAKDYDCMERINSPIYPGGLSIEHAGVTGGEFIYLSEWDKPTRMIPETTQLPGHAIQSEYDGLGVMFYCYQGEWIIRVRH